MALIYVTGGAKSGKSKFAEDLLLSLNNGSQKNVYLATSLVFDEEMELKVELHRQRRENKWITIEGYKEFSSLFMGLEGNNMLVDCLTNMVSNIIFEDNSVDWDKPTKEQMKMCDEKVEKEVAELIEAMKNFDNVVVVSNELGLGIVPSYPLGRYFREIAGKMNQLMAAKAEEAYFVVSGIPMRIK